MLLATIYGSSVEIHQVISRKFVVEKTTQNISTTMLSFFNCSTLAWTNRTYCGSIPGGGTAGKRKVTPPNVRRGPGMGGGGMDSGNITNIPTHDLRINFWGLRGEWCEGTSWLGIGPQLRFCEHWLAILAVNFNHPMSFR